MILRIIIFSVCIVLVIICVVLAFYLINKLQRDNNLECPVDFCATNIITGEKRCPPQGSSLTTSDAIEVCNPRRSCVNPLTPFLLYDFKVGTVINNFCPPEISDEDCRCMNSQYCPNYVSSYFSNLSDTWITLDSYQNPIVRSVTVNDIPLAVGSGSTCSIADPNLIWPRQFNVDNRCLNGRLVFQDGRYICKKEPQIEEIICESPNRIIFRDGDYVCENV